LSRLYSCWWITKIYCGQKNRQNICKNKACNAFTIIACWGFFNFLNLNLFFKVWFNQTQTSAVNFCRWYKGKIKWREGTIKTSSFSRV